MKRSINGMISAILAVIIISISLPLALAAEPVNLSETNILSWPTAIGEIWFGQKISDGITLTGGVVTTDGTESGDIIQGHFEFINPSMCPTAPSDAMPSSIKFIPDDSENYTEFQVLSTNKVTYKIKKVTPVLVDENDPPIATEVKTAGARLGTSMLSGGKVKNPYVPDDAKVGTLVWSWTDRRAVVSNSGYYEAQLTGTGYETIKMMVYVRIAGNTAETSISEYPTIPELTYDPNVVWSDITLTGGKAVIYGSSTEIAGTFTFTDAWKDKVPAVGTYNVGITFIPDDITQASPYLLTLPVTVNKGTVKFVDESGEEIVPEITLPYGFKVGDDLNGYLKEYLNVSASFNYSDTEDYGKLITPGSHEYEVKVSVNNSNFEGGTLKFKVIVNQLELELKVKDVVGGKQIYIEGGDTYHLNGNFDVKYFIDGKEAGTIEGVKFNETFEVKQDKSGVYTYEIVYNEAENDPYKVTKVTAAADDIKLQHSVKINGNEPVVYTYGEKVTVTAPAHEKPYYVFTGWGNSAFAPAEDDGEVSDTFTFSMPDEDVEIEATYEFSIKAFFEYIFSLIVDFFAKIAEFLQLQKVCDFFAGIFAV